MLFIVIISVSTKTSKQLGMKIKIIVVLNYFLESLRLTSSQILLIISIYILICIPTYDRFTILRAANNNVILVVLHRFDSSNLIF